MSLTLAPTFLAAIFALMPAPSPAWGESGDAFKARMGMIAVSVEKGVERAPARSRYQLGLAVISVFWGESRFSPVIHSGEKLGDGGAAICLGQHHRLKLTEDEWRALGGVDEAATVRCAQATASALVSAWWYCQARDAQATYAEAFVLYGTGQTCQARESRWAPIFKDRANKWKSLVYSCKKGPSACLPWGKT